MNAKSVFATALALALPTAAIASEPQERMLETVRATAHAPTPIVGFRAMQLLGIETDMDARQVRMVLTTEANHQAYLFRRDQKVAWHFAQSLGDERFADLVAGKPIRLYSPAVLEAARSMAMVPNDGKTLTLLVANP